MRVPEGPPSPRCRELDAEIKVTQQQRATLLAELRRRKSEPTTLPASSPPPQLHPLLPTAVVPLASVPVSPPPHIPPPPPHNPPSAEPRYPPVRLDSFRSYSVIQMKEVLFHLCKQPDRIQLQEAITQLLSELAESRAMVATKTDHVASLLKELEQCKRECEALRNERPAITCRRLSPTRHYTHPTAPSPTNPAASNHSSKNSAPSATSTAVSRRSSAGRSEANKTGQPAPSSSNSSHSSHSSHSRTPSDLVWDPMSDSAKRVGTLEAKLQAAVDRIDNLEAKIPAERQSLPPREDSPENAPRPSGSAASDFSD